MKEYLSIFIILLVISFCPNLVQNQSNNSDSIDYLNLVIDIFQKLETECYPELKGLFDERLKFEKDKKYPWLIDTMGKGINDIGDEIECLYSLQNTTFFLVNFYQLNFSKILDNDQKLLDYLDIKNYTLGFCVMYNCRDAFRRYMRLIAEFINFIATNKTADYSLVSFIEDSRINQTESWNQFNDEVLETKNWKLAIIWIIIIVVLIKLLGGILRTFTLPKGYDKYIAEKLNKLNQNEDNKNFDLEEKTNLSNKNKFNESLIDDTIAKDYNPIFDFSEKLPIKIRILRIFDLFNDLHYLSSKRNRYFNDSGLEVIVFLRALMIFGMIFSNTFSALIALPSEEIINSSFFKSWSNIFYRISNNSLNCWLFLEGVYTTYKLLCFITSEMFIYYAKEEKLKHSLNIKLLKVFAKFLILLIPKMATFVAIYYFLYYKIEDYAFVSNAKATFKYVVIHVLKQNINCSSIVPLFKNIFTDDMSDVNHCYEFAYFYVNMFFSILLFMVIMYLFFIIRNKIFEIAFISLGLIYFIVSIFLINDDDIKQTIYLRQYHIIGQTYTSRIFISFISFYLLGFIVGFLLFNSDSLKAKINRLLYEYDGIHLTKQKMKIKEDDGPITLKDPLAEQNDLSFNSRNSRHKSEDSGRSDDMSENSPNYYKNFILPYYPLKYLNKILFKISKLRLYVKVLLILGSILLLFGIDFILLGYVMASSSFDKELNDFIIGIFKSEKHIYIIFFCFMTIIMITLPKKGTFRNFISSKIFISISRIGFLISCFSYAMTYFSFIVFSIRVKLYVPTFLIISFGNFLVFYIICFVFDTVSELPIKIIIKKLMRIHRRKESIIL